MRRLSGQAGVVTAVFTGRVLHRLGQIALAMVMVAACGTAALAWRLSEGPLELTWLARRIEAVANADQPTTVSIASAALAWNGFHRGTDRPLHIVLADVRVRDSAGETIAEMPHGALSVSLPWLAIGQVVPRALEIDGLQLRLFRAADGATTLDLGSLAESADATDASPRPATPLAEILRALSRPIASDHDANASHWAQLRLVSVHDAAIVVVDRQMGTTWMVPHIDIDLRRQRAGGLQGSATLGLALGDQQATLHVEAALPATGGGTTLHAELSRLIPAHLAALAPGLAPLVAVDAPLTLSADAELRPDLTPARLAVHAVLGAGQLHLGDGVTTVADAIVDATGTLDAATVTVTRLALTPHPGGPLSVVRARIQTQRADGKLTAGVVVDLDQASFADLPALWPAGVGGPGTRPWITKNITAGMARDAHVEVKLEAPEDFSDATLLSVAGGLDGQDVTVHWLRPVPPLEHVGGHLTLTGSDVIDIALNGGRQSGTGLTAQGGHVRLIGIAGHDQFADIDADISGPLADLLTLLKNPKIKLLDRRPVPIHDPSGQIAGKLSISQLPLKDNLLMDDLKIHTAARLSGVHLGGVAAGHDLDHGMLDLDAGNDGLAIKGTADLAGIPAHLAVDMDFRTGAPTQVLQHIAVQASPTAAQITAAGLDMQGYLTGAVGVDATYQSRRDGRGDIALKLDLSRAAVQAARFGMAKPAGQAASGEAHVVLDHDRLTAIDHVAVTGTGIDIRGGADAAGGRAGVLKLDRLLVGRTDLHGEIRLPQTPAEGYGVRLAGGGLDASGVLTSKDAKPPAKSAPEPATHTPFTVDLAVGRVWLANGVVATEMAAHVVDDGRVLREARVAGLTAPEAPFSLKIGSAQGGRHLTAEAADTGALLRGLDMLADLQGGRLTVEGRYDDATASHRLAGSAELLDFHVRGTAALGKILQAMTLYGVVEALDGPGLGFTRLTAPFSYADHRLTLTDARAFSASLGMTAKGTIDSASETIDMQGTIVPAYFFNSLLGKVPLIGRVFSPERGGGLFAATYGVHGALDDPSVGVNPLAALTPGFLRGVFGLFD